MSTERAKSFRALCVFSTMNLATAQTALVSEEPVFAIADPVLKVAAATVNLHVFAAGSLGLAPLNPIPGINFPRQSGCSLIQRRHYT